MSYLSITLKDGYFENIPFGSIKFSYNDRYWDVSEYDMKKLAIMFVNLKYLDKLYLYPIINDGFYKTLVDLIHSEFSKINLYDCIEELMFEKDLNQILKFQQSLDVDLFEAFCNVLKGLKIEFASTVITNNTNIDQLTVNIKTMKQSKEFSYFQKIFEKMKEIEKLNSDNELLMKKIANINSILTLPKF